MGDSAHVLIVDDEADVRETFAEYLRLRGFRVSEAESGDGLRRIMASDPADIVLLDLRMPGEDGLSLARYLRASTNAGIVMVTAMDDSVDRVIGLEMGADDYVGKTCEMRELLARVRSVLRRRQTPPAAAPAGGAAPARPAEQIPFGRFVLDLAARRLLDSTGSQVTLTASEFDLLKTFATHPNRVLTRDQLLDMAHKRDYDPFDRSIDVRVTRIRRKIEVDPTKPQLIKTVRSAGYMFVPAPDA